MRVLPNYCTKCGRKLRVHRNDGYEYLKCPRTSLLWTAFAMQEGHDRIFVGKYKIDTYDPMTGEKVND